MADHVASWAERVSDATVRAWRTFYVSIGVDILAAIGTGILLMVDGADVLSATFWLGVLALAVRSTVTAAATYWVRHKFPPVNAPVVIPTTPTVE
jgi:uncharacterized membrane protein